MKINLKYFFGVLALAGSAVAELCWEEEAKTITVLAKDENGATFTRTYGFNELDDAKAKCAELTDCKGVVRRNDGTYVLGSVGGLSFQASNNDKTYLKKTEGCPTEVWSASTCPVAGNFYCDDDQLSADRGIYATLKFINEVSSLKACHDACAAEDKCAHFTVYNQSKGCKLFSADCVKKDLFDPTFANFYDMSTCNFNEEEAENNEKLCWETKADSAFSAFAFDNDLMLHTTIYEAGQFEEAKAKCVEFTDCQGVGMRTDGKYILGGISGTVFSSTGATAYLKKDCKEVNECTTGDHDCGTHSDCTDTDDGFTCACQEGYASENDGKNCEDIDECKEGNDNCDSNASCSNTDGSHRCICNVGFTGDGATCADVNECNISNGGCDSNASCANNPGGHECTCNAGFTGNGYTCADVNECNTSNHGCDSNASCVNDVGSHECICQAGFTGNGYTCADIDECKEGKNNCDSNASCANKVGSFSCSCNKGYTGDGTAGNCVDKCADGLFTVSCSVTSGFTVTIKEDCKAQNYPQLTDYTTIFAYETDFDLTPNPSHVIESQCKFKSSGTLTYGFNTCGTSKHSEGTGYTVFTSYINQQIVVSGVKASILDRTKIECRFSNVDLNVGNNISENNEKTGSDNIDSLQTDLSLALKAGKGTGTEFAAFGNTEKIDVGTSVTVQLQGSATFDYALSGCKAKGSDNNEVGLYQGYCPTADSNIVSLNKIDSKEFKLNLFRSGSSTTLTFTCTVKVFPKDGLPSGATDCTGVNSGARRRRSDDGDLNTEDVEVTVNLSDDDFSSAAETCANVLVPTILFASFF